VAFALLPTSISAACLACAAFRSQFCTDSEAIDQPPSCIGSGACALIPDWTLQRFHPDIFQGKTPISGGPNGWHSLRGLSRTRRPVSRAAFLSSRDASIYGGPEKCDKARPADALDTGHKPRLSRQPAAAVVAHLVEDGTDLHIAPWHVRLVDQLNLVTAITFDPRKPRRKSVERFVEGLGASRERIGAVAAPMALWRWPGHPERRTATAARRVYSAFLNHFATRGGGGHSFGLAYG
jgi:hypothetical protein